MLLRGRMPGSLALCEKSDLLFEREGAGRESSLEKQLYEYIQI